MPVVTDQNLDFNKASDERTILGESPFWSPQDQCVWWVDIEGCKLLRTSLDDIATQVWEMPQQIGFAIPHAAGGLILGMEQGLYRFDPKNGTSELVFDLGQSDVRFNDATTDSRGRIWAGIMHIDNTEQKGILYRIDPDLSVHKMLDGLMTPNGLCIDEARGRLYLSDSHPSTQTIWQMDLDLGSGAIGARKTFVDMHDMTGRPDGGALDAEGNYWIAAVGGAALHVFSPDATHIRTVSTQMQSPTKIAFAGAGLDRIIMTSKSDPNSPNGGFLMQVESDVVGAAQTVFGQT